MADNKVNSGLLEFSEDQKVFVALDAETSEVKKAVTIDGDGVETDIQGVQPSGKKEITSTDEVNVASYATAQVVDEDLVAGNIKKDVDILGVVGSYEGGASDFSTAEVTLNKGALGEAVDCILPWLSEEDNESNAFLTLDEETEAWTVKVPLGGDFINVYFSKAPASVSGNIEASGDITIMTKTLKNYVISGNCTITFL